MGSLDIYHYGCTFDGNYAGSDGGAIFANTSPLKTRVETYGCTFINNQAAGHGGAVNCDPASEFLLASDENGKPAIVKNNVAGQNGGGIFSDNVLGYPGLLEIAGEVYVSGNVSANGQDDIYVSKSSGLSIGEITSPAGSIGIRFGKAEGGFVAEFGEGVSLGASPFFANNEGFNWVLK